MRLDVTYDVIGNPHYPYVIVDLGLQLSLGLCAPLWCHNDYLALGYEVLRKRNPPCNAYVSNDVILYTTLTPRISQRSRDV